MHESLVPELVKVDCELRHERSQSPTRADYHGQLPQWKEQVDEGFSQWAESFSATVSEATGTDSSGMLASGNFTLVEQFGDYRIIREIGRGGMGVVYEAEQESLNRRVAIKTLTHTDNKSLVVRFQREARAVARLHHTNIVEVFGSGVENGRPYIAMQLIHGRGLDDVIEELPNQRDAKDSVLTGPRSDRFVANIGMQVAAALAHAHDQGVLHRDIKPANLLIDEHSNAWVSDFGLAKLQNDASDVTVAGSIMGTLRYLPPESFKGEWDERADIYALGLTLYELIALEPAYPEAEQNQLMNRIINGDSPPALVNRRPSISIDLDTIIMKACAKDAAARYQTAKELSEDLRRFLAGEPILARRATVVERVWKWSRRKPVLASLLTLIAAVVLIGFPTMALLWRQAETARSDAEYQHGLAIDAAEDARLAADTAKRAQEEAEQQRNRAEASNYGSEMLLAQQYLASGDSVAVEQILAGWTPDENDGDAADHRGWEWHYLKSQLSEPLWTITDEELPYVWAIEVHPDGSQVASVHGFDVSAGQNTKLQLSDATTGERQFALSEPDARIFGMAYSPDGKTLATNALLLDESAGRGRLSLWNPQTGERLRSTILPGKFDRKNINGFFGVWFFPSVEFTADGKQIITTPGRVELFDADTLEPAAKYKTQSRLFLVADDGTLLAFYPPRLRVLDPSKGMVGQPGREIRPGAARQFAVTASGQTLAVATRDSQLALFRMADFTEIARFDIPGLTWGGLSPDGLWRVAGTRSGTLMLDPQRENSRKPIRLIAHATTIQDAKFSQESQWLVTASLDGTVKRWNLDDILPPTAVPSGVSMMSALRFTSDGQRVVFASERHNRDFASAGALSVGEPASVECATIESTWQQYWPRTDFAFSRDATVLAAPVGRDEQPTKRVAGYPATPTIGIWSTNDWQEQHRIDVNFDFITSVRWNEANHQLAVAGLQEDSATQQQTSLIRIYDVQDTVTHLADIPHTTAIHALGFRANQLAASTTGAIDVWQLTGGQNGQGTAGEPSWQHAKTFTGAPIDRVVFLDFSPDEELLACADMNNNQFFVFDTPSDELLWQQHGPKGVRCVRFSPDGKRLAVAGSDSEVQLYDPQIGRAVLSLTANPVSAGTRPVNARVIFSPDGKRLAVNDWQNNIMVWTLDASTNRR